MPMIFNIPPRTFQFPVKLEQFDFESKRIDGSSVFERKPNTGGVVFQRTTKLELRPVSEEFGNVKITIEGDSIQALDWLMLKALESGGAMRLVLEVSDPVSGSAVTNTKMGNMPTKGAFHDSGTR